MCVLPTYHYVGNNENLLRSSSRTGVVVVRVVGVGVGVVVGVVVASSSTEQKLPSHLNFPV